MVDIIEQAFSLLADECGIDCDDRVRERLDAYHKLILEWNSSAGLISSSDTDRLDIHTVDSLSLLPYIIDGEDSTPCLIDVGSGGGFPAIPLKIVLDAMPFYLVERSEVKASFLRKVVRRLRLSNTTVLIADFPRLTELPPFHRITARAVERPELLMRQIVEILSPDSAFLCQFPPDRVPNPPGCQCAHIDDKWSEKGLRRGSLRVIRPI